MIHENFIKIVQQESHEFKALMNILVTLNAYAEEGRKLLCILNHIIDFYLLREIEGDEDVKMPIVYFPLCEEWAQLLCEEFVALKMSLLWGYGTRTELLTNYRCKPYIHLPEGANKKERVALTKQFKFKRDVTKHITNEVLSYPSSVNEKCLLYSRNISDEFQFSTKFKGHYHFSHDIMGLSLSTDKSLVLLGENEKDVYDEIEKNDGKIKIPNIFLFLQKDMDGRNSQLCMQMQRSTINEYNEDYDAGIHNVIFFAFSQKPYRLQRVYENKCNLVERLQREKIAETRDFISFTKAEMDYIFSREVPCTNIYELDCNESSEQYEIKKAFDFMLQDISHEVKLRNELAICFTEQTCKKIKDEILEQNPEANNEYIEYFLQLLQNEYKNQLSVVLSKWINFCHIAVVLDYNVNLYYKNELELFLKSECGATIVSFYTFKNLKAHKEGNKFLNSIPESKILVLSMLNHCTGRNWAIYPNSFDQYHLNPRQSVLQINNKFVFDPRLSWYQYRYVEQLKLLLNSNFRIKYVKNNISLPSKPTNVGPEPKDDEDEQNIRNRQLDKDQNRVVVSYAPRQHRTFDEDELVLCKYQDNISICSISDIMRNFDDPTDIEIQPLIDFHQPLEIIINDEERKIGDGEIIIRTNPKYCLTDEEKKSKREMWKIILEHRVTELGEQTVYNEIMKSLLPIERIQFGSFRRWLDPLETSILPRSRRMQKRVLEEYLQIEGLYTRMLRHRKSRISTNTEGKNSIFKTFLIHCLLESDTQKAFNGLSHEVRDYLNIEDGNDIKVIIDLIKDEFLNFRQIKSLKYDQK
jgi:hypothetical protein